MNLDLSCFVHAGDLIANDPPKPGRYHVRIVALRPAETALVVSMKILGGTVPGQQGKVIRERFMLPEIARTRSARAFAVKRMARLALALHLIHVRDLGSREVAVAWRHAIGREALIELVGYQYQRGGQTRRGLWIEGLSIYALDDPAAADVPRFDESPHDHLEPGPAGCPSREFAVEL